MMRIFLLILLFIICCVAISKAIALLVPASIFYSIANTLQIYGDESIIDFILIVNISVSILLSLILIVLLKRKK
ncbi:hypothetical protein NB714_003101 [Pantoea dispersa]|nr:hypothetical protein [Pantoea dispersa]MCW0326976.1 hypothetical protein [Pantoea dispersa]MCW0433152.1 hypothetical protein [Pantoea dispersa]